MRNIHESFLGRRKGITEKESYSMPLNRTANVEDGSKHSRSWRRPPSAGNGHDRDQESFLTKRAEQDGRVAALVWGDVI